MTGESRGAGVSAERVAAVDALLAEHRWSADGGGDGRWCTCGWKPKAPRAHAHRAHVAAVVAAALDDGLSERVEALDERWAQYETRCRQIGGEGKRGEHAMARREANTWDVARHELRAILAAQPTTAGADA